MTSLKKLTADDRARLEDMIDDIFQFTRDVVDDPSLLDQLPERANLSLIRRAPQEESELNTTRVLTPHVIVDVQPDAARRITRNPRHSCNAPSDATWSQPSPESSLYQHGSVRATPSTSGAYASRRRHVVRQRVSSNKRIKKIVEALRKRSA